MTVRRPLTFPVVLAALALVATACSTATKKAAPPPTRPEFVERIRLNGDGDFGFPSPFTHRAGRGFNRVTLLFDTLIWKDGGGTFLPWLAKEWSRSADGLEWRFTLREGVRWQDGRPLTAADVAFTFDYLQKGAGLQVGASVTFRPQIEVKEVVTESPTVAVFRLDQPFAPTFFEDQVAGRVPIIPKHIWETVTDPAKFTQPAAAMGSGPYRLESYDASTGSYLFVANESYFLGTPYVRRIEYVPADNELLALRVGDIDIANIGISEEPLVEESLEPFAPPAYTQLTAPGAWNRVLHFNLTKGFPFNDKAFRQAVAYAVDRQDLVKRALLGNGEPGSAGALAPSNPWLAPDLPAYNVDVVRAKALLDGIGLTDADGDGFRDLPDGSRFRPEVLTNARHSSKTAEMIKEYLRTVGIDVSILSLDSTSADTAGRDGNYQMAIVGYANGVNGDPDLLRQRLSSAVKAKAFTRVYGWNNPAFEAAAAKQLVTLDPAERLRYVQEMQRAVAEDVPLISLYVPTRTVVSAAAVFDGWYFTPGGIFGSLGEPDNKHVFVTGKRSGLPEGFAG
jgi:peptide/nickel transport system substrate-binding protein